MGSKAVMPSVTTAVFRSLGADRLTAITVHLEADVNGTAVADAAARGFVFAGTIAVVDGEPQTTIEPDDPLAPAAVLLAGPAFATLLGPVVQRHQLAMKAAGVNGGAPAS